MKQYLCNALGDETNLITVLVARNPKDAAMKMWCQLEEHGFAKADHMAEVPEMPDIYVPVQEGLDDEGALVDFEQGQIVSIIVFEFQVGSLYDVEGTVLE